MGPVSPGPALLLPLSSAAPAVTPSAPLAPGALLPQGLCTCCSHCCSFSCRAVQRCTPGQGCLGHPACQRPALLLCFPSVMLSLLNALHFVYPSCSVLVSPDVSSVNTGTLSVHGCALSTNDASHGVSPVSAGWADYRALRRGLKSYRVLDQTTCPHFHVSHLVLKHLL